MSDDDIDKTPVPELTPEDQASALEEVHERLTKTGPFTPEPLTVQTVISLFEQFRKDIFTRLDERDRNIVKVIRDGQDRILIEYEEWTRRTDTAEADIRKLRQWRHDTNNRMTVILDRLDLLEAEAASRASEKAGTQGGPSG